MNEGTNTTHENAEELLVRARAALTNLAGNPAISSDLASTARQARERTALTAVDAALAALRSSGPESERVAPDAGRIGFLSTVCHDLKDPLAAVVMGSSFLLRETKNAPEGDRVQRMVQAIHRAGTRMGGLLQNLTDFVHLTTGRRAFDLRDHPLAPILERVVEKNKALAETAGVRVLIDAPTDLRVVCDSDALSLAVDHLLSNAFRYSPHGAEVHIEATAHDGRVDLRVRDSGPGVTAERLPHMFDTYWNARQKARDGVGLGLGIVNAIATAHGESATAESSARGTSVGFALKQATSQPA